MLTNLVYVHVAGSIKRGSPILVYLQKTSYLPLSHSSMSCKHTQNLPPTFEAFKDFLIITVHNEHFLKGIASEIFLVIDSTEM